MSKEFKKYLQFKEHVLYLLYERFAFLPFHREGVLNQLDYFKLGVKPIVILYK